VNIETEIFWVALFRAPFYDVPSVLNIITSNGRILNERERILKTAVLAYSKY
jgi:hypothetical protein